MTEDTHEEKAEGAQSAVGGGVSGVRARHAADLVAYVVKSPTKGVERETPLRL